MEPKPLCSIGKNTIQKFLRAKEMMKIGRMGSNTRFAPIEVSLRLLSPTS